MVYAFNIVVVAFTSIVVFLLILLLLLSLLMVVLMMLLLLLLLVLIYTPRSRKTVFQIWKCLGMDGWRNSRGIRKIDKARHTIKQLMAQMK